MKTTVLSSILFASRMVLTKPVADYGVFDPEAAARSQLEQWHVEYQTNLDTYVDLQGGECTTENMVNRKEWRTLSSDERHEYTDAVKCLMELPSQTDPTRVPGARSRYDDFVVTHMLTANISHHDGLFLTFHRYFTWLYETALRDECGYTGYQPYWDWTLDWMNLAESPVLDGSSTSMGGNGAHLDEPKYVNDTGLGFSTLLRPGTGGGCVDSGPFANTTINLGPVALLPAGPLGGFGYNPRCLHRDFSAEWSRNMRPSDIVNQIAVPDTVEAFDVAIEGLFGSHAAGHFGVGGIMADQFVSTADPVFFLHHGMIDYLWTLWQSRDFEGRTFENPGRTETARNNPPSPNASLESMIDTGILAPMEKLGNLVSTVAGPFCYRYL